MSIVRVAIRAGLFPSKASTPKVGLESKTAIPNGLTNTEDANRDPVGDTALMTRPQRRISVKKARKVNNAQ